MTMTCAKCREMIQWEMFAGWRVYRETPRGTAIYMTRCACGSVRRLSNGKRAR